MATHLKSRIPLPTHSRQIPRALLGVLLLAGPVAATGQLTVREVAAKPYQNSVQVLRAPGPEAPEAAPTKPAAVRPNILWFVVDDMSAHLSCYGETTIETPHVDRLAREGTRFRHAFVTAPVCSPCRSALITGCYQTTLGAHHHRSGRGVQKIHLPAGVVPLPTLLQQAGYFTCNGNGLPVPPRDTAKPNARSSLGKTDYNFEWDPRMYDASDWAERRPGQPFFMQVQLAGGKLRGDTDASTRRLAERAARELGRATDPAKVTLPPYYPRDPVLLRDWAAYLDSIRLTDVHVGRVLARLEAEGILERTLVIFMTDNGISHARGKQFLYDEGTQMPFIVRGPGIPRGQVREDLLEHIDLAAISLAAAGLPLPPTMQARNVFAPDYRPRDAVFAARDRCDETVDRIRSVRTDRFLYVRNFHPQRPLLQPNAYKDAKAILQTLRALHAAGTLDPVGEALLFSPTRPAEELYEWKTDRWQVNNLANHPAHQATLATLRARLDRWMLETGDRGPESDAMYDSDMAVYLDGRNDAQEAVTRRNLELMKQWAREGK
jgi:arylsulfatase A-like enzyme